MPPVVAALVAMGLTAVGAYVVIATVVLSAGMAVYGAAQARKAERGAKNDALAAMKDRMVTRIATESPHRYIYGRAKVGADIVAMFTSGDRDQYKHLVCVHAAHECDAIEEVWVNNALVSGLDGSGDPTTGRFAVDPDNEIVEENVTGPTFTLQYVPSNATLWAFSGSGANMLTVNVTGINGRTITVDASGPVTVSYMRYSSRKMGDGVSNSVRPTSNPVVRVRKHLGDPNDPADAYLRSVVGDKWPATAVLRGLCYTVITLDLNHPEFQSGLVPIHAVIRGKRLYDPRDGVTRWSQNPALAIRDYLTGPLCGVPAADLPTAQFIAAANVCDEASPTGGARYTLNGTVTSDQGQASVLESMVQAMAGGLVATTWDVYAGKYVAPVAALLQSDIVGGLSVTPGVSDASIYNGVKGQYIGPENQYVQTDFKPYQNSAYRAADARDLYTNIDFPFTESLQRVTNLARVFTEDQRNGFTIRAEFSLKAWPLKVGQRITFTGAVLGHNAKVFRITDKSYSPTSAVQLTLKEDAASIWDYADATVVDSTPNSDLPDPWKIDAPASLSCTSGEAALLRQADGTTVPRIMASWPAMAQANGVQVEVEWRAVQSITWERTTVSASELQAYLSPITPGFFYIVRARTVNPSLGLRSNWIATVYQVEVFTATPTVYIWAANKPATPAGAASYSWPTGTFGAAPAGWSLSIPTTPIGGNVILWAAVVAVSDVSDVASSFNWSQAEVRNQGYAPSAAGQGPAGYSNARVFAYQRKSSAPTGTPGAVDYDFQAGTITTATLLNGWQKTIPASDGNPLYVTSASASAAGNTDTIASNEWSGAVVLAYDGGAGTPGINTATISLYQRAATATAPALPNANATYTFATGAITGLTNGWQTFIPSTGGQYLHRTQATAIGTTATDTIPPGEWAAVQLMYDAADLIAAKAAADAANAAIANIASDNVLSKGEKPELMLKWAAIDGEKPGLVAQALALGVSSTDYGAKFQAVSDYLVGISPLYSDLTQDSPINGVTFRTTFANYYTAKQALLNAIAAKSASVANSDNSIRTPIGAKYSTTTPTITGAIKIRLPQSYSSTMMRFTVDIFEFLAGYSCTMEIAGYNYSDASSWLNVTARVIGGSNVEYPVYFGHDGTMCCVWIGNAGDTWAFPQVQVRDFFAGFLNVTRAQWETGWNISFDAAAPTNVTASVLDTYPAADWRKVAGAGKPADYATSGAPAGSLVAGVDAATVVANASGAASAILTPFTVSASGALGGSYPNGSSTYGTITLNPEGGTGPYSIEWSLAVRYKTSTSSRININGGAGSSATVSGTGTNCETTATLTAVVIDANNRAKILNFNCNAVHGTAP
jgi:hypothetical protein